VKPVYLLGAGLETCLGSGLAAQLPALRGARAQVPRAADSELAWPYHFIDGFTGHERLYGMLGRSVEQSLAEVRLSADQRKRLAIFVGSTCLDLPLHESAYAKALSDETAGHGRTLIHGPGYGNVAAWIAQRFGIEGPQYTLNTACSSSANALLHARLALGQGLAEHALVVGVEAYTRLSLQGFGSLLLLSKQSYRPFDRDRDGLILGEGSGAMLLGRAQPAGEKFSFALCGAASACDPSSPTNSLPERVADVMRAALDDAGLRIGQLAAIKAHGTGTASNDLSEGQGMRLLDRQLPPFTSLKPYTGHTLGAGGVIETLLLLAAWREGFLPGTPGFAQADDAIGLAPVAAAAPMPERGAVLCNFFGFGGNNTSLVFSRT
jgi:3-oxoacyl-[acyl-carrier-protein] synthase-1